MSKRIDRRAFVRSALTAGAGLAPSAGWSAAQKARLATEGAFAQGVASGEPATNAVTPHPNSVVFTLRRFRVDSGQPAVIDQGGPLPA